MTKLVPYFFDKKMDLQQLYQPDPFTALVEADRWYKENIECPTKP